MQIPFLKMNGAGNDFVVFDARQQKVALASADIETIASRHNDITQGCDQVIAIEKSAKADAFMRIYNADGSEVDACGNASRCVAALLMHEKKVHNITLETLAGILLCESAEHERVTVDMGAPRLEWNEIPLTEAHDTLHLPITLGELTDPTAVSMGNPHMVFFVSDVFAIDLTNLGPKLEHHPLFPKRVNVSIAQVEARDEIVLRVWERGAGETLACGTAACATLVAANRRGLADKKATITLPGGDLDIEWRDDGHIWMTGPVATNFEGVLTL